MNKRFLTLTFVVGVSVMACASGPSPQWQSDHFSEDKGFYNKTVIEQEFSIGRFLAISQRFLFDDSPNTEAFDLIPVEAIDPNALQQ